MTLVCDTRARFGICEVFQSSSDKTTWSFNLSWLFCSPLCHHSVLLSRGPTQPPCQLLPLLCLFLQLQQVLESQYSYRTTHTPKEKTLMTYSLSLSPSSVWPDGTRRGNYYCQTAPDRDRLSVPVLTDLHISSITILCISNISLNVIFREYFDTHHW